MATSTITISNGSSSPAAGPLTVTDSTPTDTNYIAFTNATTHGIEIIGTGGWDTYFSENNIVLPTSSGSNTVTLALKVVTAQGVEEIQYTLGYTDYMPPIEDETDPVFTITVNP